MVTTNDVASVLLTNTTNGQLEWTATRWREDGAPYAWRLTVEEGTFHLYDNPVELFFRMPQMPRNVSIGSGGKVEDLLKFLQANDSTRGVTTNEAISMAYETLSSLAKNLP